MVKKLAAIATIIMLATVLLWGATYTSGSLAVSIPAGTATTGAGITFFFPGIYKSFSWQVIVSGGTATAITTNFECAVDGTTFNQFDQSTSTSGEFRSVSNKPALGCRCNITLYTVNGTTAACQFVASADPR